MIRNLTFSAVAASLALMSSSAFAQQAQPAQAQATGGARNMAVNDTLFATAAAAQGLSEMSLSQLGVQRATDPDLKKFSQQMIDEHTKMNGELMQLAGQKQIPLPRALDARAQFCAESLAGLTGQEFDKCYAKAQLVAHMESLAAFEAEAERGQDPQMKALASRGVSHIREHLNQIKPIAQKYMDEKSERK